MMSIELVALSSGMRPHVSPTSPSVMNDFNHTIVATLLMMLKPLAIDESSCNTDANRCAAAAPPGLHRHSCSTHQLAWWAPSQRLIRAPRANAEFGFCPP
jgi:hypothetical protein